MLKRIINRDQDHGYLPRLWLIMHLSIITNMVNDA